MAPTTPIGTRSVKPSLPSPASSASSGTTSPASVRASAAANWNVPTARSASTRAVLIGLAASRAMIVANSSRRSPSSPRRDRGSPHASRAAAGGRGSAAAAAITARSTSAGVAAGTSPITTRRRASARRRWKEPSVSWWRRRPGEPAAREPSCERRYCRRCRPLRPPSTRSSTGPVRSPSPIAAAQRRPGEHDAGVRGRGRPRLPLPRDRRHASPPTASLVAFHDDDLMRTCGRPGKISELPWSEVRTAMVDGKAPIPSLEELLGTFPDGAGQHRLQGRRRGATPSSPRSKRTDSIDRVCLASFSDRRLKQLRAALGPRACTSLGPAALALLRFGLMRHPHGHAAQVPVKQWFITVTNAKFVERAHDLGLQVHVWTIDDPAEMNRLLDLGVDGIMTDQAARAQAGARGPWPVARATVNGRLVSSRRADRPPTSAGPSSAPCRWRCAAADPR